VTYKLLHDSVPIEIEDQPIFITKQLLPHKDKLVIFLYNNFNPLISSLTSIKTKNKTAKSFIIKSQK